VLFHDFVALSKGEREGKRPFIWTLDAERRRRRVSVSKEIVQLAEERLGYWHQLRELAGLDVAEEVRDRLTDEAERRFREEVDTLRADYERRLQELRANLPAAVARRMARGLLAHGGGGKTVDELLRNAFAAPLPPLKGGNDPLPSANGANGADGDAGSTENAGSGAAATASSDTEEGARDAATAKAAVTPDAPPAAAAAAADVVDAGDDDLALEPWIESALCTSCNECTNINGQLFAYNEVNQAYIKDARAGTFAQIVQAAEKCPAAIIHPGTPLNPNEKNLEKWVKRAEPFN
jgi:pyruvate-ferredoxin/flavodoxin oxidoreductase